MKNTLIAVIVIGILAIIGFYTFNAYIYHQKQGGAGDGTSYRGTLTGEVVCLPHVDTGGPTTMECALGLKTETGEYYALDLAAMSQEYPPLDTGERITANGLITPIALLSSDRWQKYDIEGIFSVTDSLKTL